jgi:uncharacterized membrane protein
MFVYFPIAIITIGFLFDILSLFVKKEYILLNIKDYHIILGILSSFTAGLTDEFFSEKLNGITVEIRKNREIFARITIFTITIATLLRTYINYESIENSKLKLLVIT